MSSLQWSSEILCNLSQISDPLTRMPGHMVGLKKLETAEKNRPQTIDDVTALGDIGLSSILLSPDPNH